MRSTFQLTFVRPLHVEIKLRSYHIDKTGGYFRSCTRRHSFAQVKLDILYVPKQQAIYCLLGFRDQNNFTVVEPHNVYILKEVASVFKNVFNNIDVFNFRKTHFVQRCSRQQQVGFACLALFALMKIRAYGSRALQ